jgi:hypothetical protein
VENGLVVVDSGVKQGPDGIKAPASDAIVTELQKQIDAWKAANKK